MSARTTRLIAWIALSIGALSSVSATFESRERTLIYSTDRVPPLSEVVREIRAREPEEWFRPNVRVLELKRLDRPGKPALEIRYQRLS